MEKIPTLFLRNPENMKLVTREINPDAAWVFTGGAVPTVKKGGTTIRVDILAGHCIGVEKRRNPTREEKANGAEPGYVRANRGSTEDKHIFAAVNSTDFAGWPDGAWPCEALGPKIQRGAENSVSCLYPFSFAPDVITEAIPLTHEGIRAYLETHPIEGIVWHAQGNTGRMCKIKRRDFGLAWPIEGEEGYEQLHPRVGLSAADLTRETGYDPS